MRNLGADVRHAIRLLLKNPRFSLIAIAALALGIGVNAAIFSVVNAVLLRPLPYPDPDRLVQACRQYPSGRGCAISIPKYVAWHTADAFQAVAAYDFAGPGMNIGGGDRPEQVRGIHVSAGYFHVFGAQLAVGRTFNDEEDRPGGPNLVLLSHRIWTSHFGGDPQMVGRSVSINGDPHTVVGVVARGFRPSPEADLSSAEGRPGQHESHTSSAAREAWCQRETPAQKSKLACFRKTTALMGSDESLRSSDVTSWSKHPHGALIPLRVGFVPLIACANVASLLRARAAGPSAETPGPRSAPGGTIIRQPLVESFLLRATSV